MAFYLHLRATERYSAKPELLRQHPILKRLLILKQSLTTLEDLSFNLSDSEESYDDDFNDDFDDDDTVDIPSSPVTPHLRLERLRTLDVTLDDANDWQHAWLLERLTTPSFNKLFIKWAEGSVPMPEESLDNSPNPCPLATFLARTTRMRTLSLKNSNKQEQEYVFSRNVPSSIVELSISGALGAPLAPATVANLRARGVLPALLQLFLKLVEDVEGVWDIVRKIDAEHAPNDSPLFLVDVNGPLDLVPP